MSIDPLSTRAVVTRGAKPGRTWTSTSARAPRLTDVLRVVLLSAGALVCLVPLVWMLLGSFKTPTELATMTFLPSSLSFENYTCLLYTSDAADE